MKAPVQQNARCRKTTARLPHLIKTYHNDGGWECPWDPVTHILFITNMTTRLTKSTWNFMSVPCSSLNAAKEQHAQLDTGIWTASLLKSQAAGGTNIPKWPGKNVSHISQATAVEAARLKHLIRGQAAIFFWCVQVQRQSSEYHQHSCLLYL